MHAPKGPGPWILTFSPVQADFHKAGRWICSVPSKVDKWRLQTCDRSNFSFSSRERLSCLCRRWCRGALAAFSLLLICCMLLKLTNRAPESITARRAFNFKRTVRFCALISGAAAAFRVLTFSTGFAFPSKQSCSVAPFKVLRYRTGGKNENTRTGSTVLACRQGGYVLPHLHYHHCLVLQRPTFAPQRMHQNLGQNHCHLQLHQEPWPFLLVLLHVWPVCPQYPASLELDRA